MPVIALALIAVIAIVALIVPAITATITRNVVSSLDRSPATGSIDQSVVEARLTRIEEAIDAMALEIERLSDHQRALLGSAPAAAQLSEADRARTETLR